jgi:glycosyltransferase involved in cell wall biosynthesis
MTKKKVFHLIDNVGIGGAQDCVLELVNSVRGVRHYGMTLHGSSRNEYVARLKKAFSNNFYVCTKKSWHFVNPISWFRLVAAIRHVSPDVIHAHLFFSFLFISLMRVLKIISPPLVVSLYGIKEQTRFFEDLGYALLKNQCHCFVTTDRKGVCELEALGIPTAKIKFIQTSYSMFGLARQDTDIRRLHGLKDEKLIVRVARFDREKGYRELIDILHKLRRKYGIVFKVLLVGDGPERSCIMEMVKAYDLENDFIFCGTKLNYVDYLISADVVVCSSIKESFGLTNIAALSEGCPFVCFSTGSLVNLKNERYRYAIEDFSVDTFADAIHEVLTDREKRDYASEFGKTFYEKYFSKSEMTEYKRIYKYASTDSESKRGIPADKRS